MKISVLDQSPRRKSGTAKEAIHETVELAKQVDKIGYHRFWVAEHHGNKLLTGTAPEILITHLLNATVNLRIGSGGILLPNYSPLKVAEVISSIQTLFPNRLDVGIGKSFGGEPHYADLLNPQGTLDSLEFQNKLNKLTELLGNSELLVNPVSIYEGNLWLLGASTFSAEFAAEKSIGFSYAHFLQPSLLKEVAKAYNGEKKHNENFIVCSLLACAATTKKAEELAYEMAVGLMQIQYNENEGLLSRREIDCLNLTEQKKKVVKFCIGNIIYGSPKEVKQQIVSWQKKIGKFELMAITITNNFNDRLKSYQLLSEINW